LSQNITLPQDNIRKLEANKAHRNDSKYEDAFDPVNVFEYYEQQEFSGEKFMKNMPRRCQISQAD